MRHLLFATLFVMSVTARALAGPASTLPSDIRPGHWAAKSVKQVLLNGVLTVQSDGKFHGDARVTHTQAVIALARLGHLLEQGQWKDTAASQPVPDSVINVFDRTDWKHQALRRYTCAAVLSRFADYFTNGVPRPKPDSKVGKSEVLEAVKVTLAPSHPAYSAVAYLAQNRMIKPDSPLLKPDDNPITGKELSAALSSLAIGLNDRLTDLGKTPDPAPPDEGTAKPKPR